MSATLACHCGCSETLGRCVHAVVAALVDDDLDGALQAGLLSSQPCPGCTPACAAMLLVAQDARRSALAARERFRTRTVRQERRQQERAFKRAAPASPSEADLSIPSLPPAAAAALARAKAKAAGRSQQ